MRVVQTSDCDAPVSGRIVDWPRLLGAERGCPLQEREQQTDRQEFKAPSRDPMLSSRFRDREGHAIPLPPKFILAPSAVPLSSSRMAVTRPLHPTTRPGGRSAGALGAFPGPARSQFAGWGRGWRCSVPSAAGSSPKWRVTGRIEIWEAPEPLEKQYRAKLAPSQRRKRVGCELDAAEGAQSIGSRVNGVAAESEHQPPTWNTNAEGISGSG